MAASDNVALILMAGWYEDENGRQWCDQCEPAGVRCGFADCTALADHRVVLQLADARVVIDRPICLEHLRYELPVRQGYTLTLTGRQP